MKTLGVVILPSLLLLAACGGGDPYVPGSGSPAGAPTTKGNFTALISFGTSASDAGSYTPATAIPNIGTIGGKFTTNSPTGTVWVENFATSLGLVITPAEVGFAEIDFSNWVGTVVSAKLPADMVAKLNTACNEVLGMPDIKRRLIELGITAVPTSTASFVTFVKDQVAVLGPAVKGAIEEALRCKREGRSETIVFNLSGHGHFDMASYSNYVAGKLVDQPYDEKELAMALAGLPAVPA